LVKTWEKTWENEQKHGKTIGKPWNYTWDSNKQHRKTMEQTILVGGIPTPLKNMLVSWEDPSQYMDK
jgi:hypothetical protein